MTDLRDATTGEADAWRAGFAEGQRLALQVLQPMINQARAAQAAAEAERDRQPTGMEYRGG